MLANEDPDVKGLYYYYMGGKIERVSDYSLYLRGKDGKLYHFFMDWKQVGDGYVQHTAKSVKDGDMAGFKWVWLTFNTEDIQKSGDLNHESYDPEQWYSLTWSDTRSLSEIVQNHKANPDEIINTNKKVKYLIQYE
jgi:hypothetical protein